MSTNTEVDSIVESGVESRVLREGYGPGAWHGADLKAALAEVTPALAFWRPAAERHNIAEIALHHAYCARAVRAQLTGPPVEPFVVKGEDWFDLTDEHTLSWPAVLAAVDAEQERLGQVVAGIGEGRASASMSDEERFGLVLGITCHAVYHAGQVQLIQRLHGDKTDGFDS